MGDVEIEILKSDVNWSGSAQELWIRLGLPLQQIHAEIARGGYHWKNDHKKGLVNSISQNTYVWKTLSDDIWFICKWTN